MPHRPGRRAADGRWRRLVALCAAALLASIAAAPGASATRPASPLGTERAAGTSATESAAQAPAPDPKHSLDLGDPGLLWTPRGEIIMEWIAGEGAFGDLAATYAATWLSLDVPGLSAEERTKYAQELDRILRANWGKREEANTGVSITTAQAIKKSNPRLYEELLKNGQIKADSVLLQTVGRNWSQAPDKNNGLLALHAEVMALKAQVWAKYIVAALKAGKSEADIAKSLRTLDQELIKLGEGPAYRKRLEQAFTSSDGVSVSSSRLSKGDLVVRQPCAGRCSTIAEDVDYVVPTQKLSDVVVGLAYAQAAMRFIDRAAAQNDEAQATTWVNNLQTVAKRLQEYYTANQSGSLDKVARARGAWRLMNEMLKQEDFQLRFNQRPKAIATKVHGVRYALQKNIGESEQQVQQRADQARKEAEKAKKKAAENAGANPTCAVSMARPRTGPAMAVFAPARRCGGSGKEGGLIEGLASSGLGGVDFTTLQMRYMSDDGSGIKYAFSAQAASPGLSQDFGAGLDAYVNSTADLRTWLVLDPDKFWVNLNPDEPERIIDPALGQTNAGKALLEADYQMKRTEGRLLDPKTDLGARYWDEVEGTCVSSRSWIVPGDVEVREKGSSLYVLKAELSVKTKADRIANAGKLACTPDSASEAHNEQLERRLVLPEVIKAVNTAPEYAPIRRAFLARVIAQWIRERHRSGHRTSFDGLIDSGDIGPAKLDDGWRPRQVYDSFVHSVQNGDFSYTQTEERGGVRYVRHMTIGGVDFSRIPMNGVSAAQMDQRQPRLSETVDASADHPATASDGSVWLGDGVTMPKEGLWTRTSGSVRAFASGRTGIAVIIVGAFVVVTFGLRAGSARTRRTS